MKRYITLVLALVLMGGYGCNREVVSGLDDSVMLKTQQLLDSYNKALIDAPNGWIIQIKTNEGFYRFWMEFKEGGIVNMLTDNIRLASSSTTVQESFYSIQQKQRATIVFETYSYLSVLNDPDNGISGGSGHVGLETDFEFEVDSFVNGVFELTGRINRVQARMIQATQDQKDGILLGGMVQEIQDLGRVSGGINNHRYIEVDGKKIGLLIKPRTTLAFYTKASGSEYVQSYPMVEVASRDLKLDNPMNVDGLIIDGFRWDQQGQKYYALSGGTEYEVKALYLITI